jgi:hypothetical protein
VTEPRDGAPDDELETEPPGDEIDDDLGDESEAIDDEALEPDLIDESEADVDAEVDDYDAAVRQVAGDEDVPPAPVVPPAERDARRRAKAPARTPSPSEIAVHVREDWSKAFVILTVAVFTLILLNGLVLGHGGLLTPIPTETPIPAESPSGSPSTSPSGSATPSGSTAPSASASTAASASPSAASTSASPSP